MGPMAFAPLDFEALDLDRLRRIRDGFLAAGDGAAGLADYWNDRVDLEQYDRVFAERIGWKWDAALDEIAVRGGIGTPATVVDWGCGTGIASRRVARAVAPDAEYLLHDRSERALAFAAEALGREAPGTRVGRMLDRMDVRPDLLLVSHVLDELEAGALFSLLALAERSSAVIWVEAGTRAVSRQLSQIRDGLLRDGGFRTLAPCTHDAACSALRADGEHWCHFFARPPVEVFADSGWVRLGRELHIDLRALPYAFVALVKDRTPMSPPGPARLVGRPDVGAKIARYWGCDADGLHRREVVKSRDKALHRLLKKEPDAARWPG